MRIRTSLAMVAVLAFCSLAVTAAPIDRAAQAAAAAKVLGISPAVPAGLGANIHFTDPRPGEMEMFAGSGMTWVRMDFTWGSTERKKGEYDFSRYDRLQAALDKHNIRALYILDYGNRLYDNEGQGPVRGHVLPPTSEEGRSAMARWAAAAVTHFRGRKILWEMWNEPNIVNFWKPKPDVQAYVKLARAVGAAIREAAPGELYIGPATSRIDMAFLEECFKGGLLEDWHAVSVHPYRQSPPETAAAEYARLREMIDRYAPTGKHVPILSGEWGYSAAWKKSDQDKQGKYMPRQWLVNLWCSVPLSIWYDWHDDGRDPHEAEHHFGLVGFEYRKGQDPVYAPKPAYEAARTLIATLNGFAFSARLDAGADDNYLMRFEKAGQARFAAWTTADKGREVTLKLPAGGYRLIGHTGKPAGTVKADAGGAKVTLSDAVVYIVPE